MVRTRLFPDPGMPTMAIEPMVPVVIYHDDRPWAAKGIPQDGSQPVLREVYRCLAPAAADVTDTLESVFEELNIGEDSSVALEYRHRGLRSLSTGDVVRIGKVVYRCDSFGWSRVSAIVHES